MESKLRLLIDVDESDTAFPEVNMYIDNKLNNYTFLSNEKVNFTQECKYSSNIIEIPRNMDILYGLEIYGVLENGELLKNKINSIDLYANNKRVLTFYLYNEICETIIDKNKYIIHINLTKIFYNNAFIPITGLSYTKILFKINGDPCIKKCFIHCALLNNNNNRNKIKNCKILVKEYFIYSGVVKNNKINILYQDEKIMNNYNFISELCFSFNKNIRDILEYITIKNGNRQIVTILTKNNIHFLEKNKFIINKFHYKTFLYNNIIIEFNFTNNNNNLICELLTTNYNILNIQNGYLEKKYISLQRNIIGWAKYKYTKISKLLYNKKVLPKNDLLCVISHEKLLNNERIISGCCFSSYNKSSIEQWFDINNKKICPICKCNNHIWYEL